MSAQYFYSSGAHMSAVLKRDDLALRGARPKRYVTRKVEETRQDGTGRQVVVTVTRQSDALPMSPSERHAMWTRRSR